MDDIYETLLEARLNELQAKVEGALELCEQALFEHDLKGIETALTDALAIIARGSIEEEIDALKDKEESFRFETTREK